MFDVASRPGPDPTRRPSPAAVRRGFRLNELGRRAAESGDLAEAERLYQEAITCCDLLGPPWFNLGLVYKSQRRWREMMVCNRHSLACGSDEQDPAFWNLGIAATALRDWETARRAWGGYGFTIPEGSGPLEMDLGPSPLRINPTESGEVVWGGRLDPARIRIDSIPVGGSGHRWHDIVLHDGEPRGTRTVGEIEYPVFDELERWEESRVPSWECLLGGDETDLAEAEEGFQRAGWALENWTTSIRRLCRSCSEGRTGDHPHGSFPADEPGFHVGIAAPRVEAVELLDRWLEAGGRRRRTDLFPLGP